VHKSAKVGWTRAPPGVDAERRVWEPVGTTLRSDSCTMRNR
jgi:hypothetical protein